MSDDRRLKPPDSSIVRQAEELARSASSGWLFNHVMRCYWFSELFARVEGAKVDGELMFLSSVLHDIGLTEHGRGTQRFEIDGAIAARTFLVDKGVSCERAQSPGYQEHHRGACNAVSPGKGLARPYGS